MFGDISEHFTVEFDFPQFKCGDEVLVGDAECTAGGVDFYCPQGAHDALLFFAAAERVRPCVKQGFFSSTLFGLTSPAEPLGIGENLFASFVGIYATLYSCHGISSW